MESKGGTEAKRYIWEGAIPLQIHLHESEVTTHPPPPPALILAPRIGYLPLLAAKIKPFFSNSLPPGVDTVWFEYKGLPLKWHIPTGVLFDLLCAEPERPWDLTVHFRGYPGNILTPCEGEESVKSNFINSLKEAAYIINGNCNNVMNMSQPDQLDLLRSIMDGNLEAYLRISSKLKLGMVVDDFSIKLKSSSPKSLETAQNADSTGPAKTVEKAWQLNMDLCQSRLHLLYVPTNWFHIVGRIPVRLYVRTITEEFDDLEDAPVVESWDKISYINRPVEVQGDGKSFTLCDAVTKLLPELFGEKLLPKDVSMEEVEVGQTLSLEETNRRSTEQIKETSNERVVSCSESDGAEIMLLRIQGIEPKMEIPFAWVVNNLMNPEFFLHICVYVKIQEPVTI